MGVTSTKSGRLEVNLSLSGKRGGKSHLGTILLSAVSGIWRFCMIIRSLLPISMETMHEDLKEPVMLIALTHLEGICNKAQHPKLSSTSKSNTT